MGDSIFEFADEFGIDSPFGNWENEDFKKNPHSNPKIVNTFVSNSDKKPVNIYPNKNLVGSYIIVTAKIEGEEVGYVQITCDGGASADGNIQIFNRSRDSSGILSFEVSRVFYISFEKSVLLYKSYKAQIQIISGNKVLDISENRFTVNSYGVVSGGEKDEVCLCKKELTIDDVKYIVRTLREKTFYQAINPANQKKENYPLTNLPYYSVDKIFHLNKTSGKYKSELVTNNSFENFTAQLNRVFEKFEINTCKRRSHFLSQVFIETQYFSQTIESDNKYTKNYDPYRGRGFMHLTHDFNYKKYKEYSKNNVVDYYSLVATNLEIAADSAGWYWQFGSIYGNINILADNKTVVEVTKAVNGGNSALKQREEAYKILIKIFDEKNC